MVRWFVEETRPDHSYAIVYNADSVEDCLAFLAATTNSNRLELWSHEHAETCKGFAPVAYREHGRVFISNTLKMLMGT